MKIWHYCFAHLNAADIIKLSEDFKFDMLIKNSKILSFCKTCCLADMKKKIFRISMSHFKYCDKIFHIDTDANDQIFDDSDDFISSFLSIKYFILIICDTIC